ncbi:MAG: type II toxin-antitoxin system RelE/ParE family toxin [Ferruginibacter sp.]
MDNKIVVTKRFRNNTRSVYQYLLKEFSQKIAYRFLDQLEQRIKLIVQHPTIGKPSSNKINIRSISLTPLNRLFYRYCNNTSEILCLFDMRRDPKMTLY